eukprot:3480862-Pyramimonas_sp.AAC.1
MGGVLAAAWRPSADVYVVAGVVDACRERSAWAGHAPQIAPLVELVAAPDQGVEGGVLFYRDLAHDR